MLKKYYYLLPFIYIIYGTALISFNHWSYPGGLLCYLGELLFLLPQILFLPTLILVGKALGPIYGVGLIYFADRFLKERGYYGFLLNDLIIVLCGFVTLLIYAFLYKLLRKPRNR